MRKPEFPEITFAVWGRLKPSLSLTKTVDLNNMGVLPGVTFQTTHISLQGLQDGPLVPTDYLKLNRVVPTLMASNGWLGDDIRTQKTLLHPTRDQPNYTLMHKWTDREFHVHFAWKQVNGQTAEENRGLQVMQSWEKHHWNNVEILQNVTLHYLKFFFLFMISRLRCAIWTTYLHRDIYERFRNRKK